MDPGPVAAHDHDPHTDGPPPRDAVWFQRLWDDSHARVYNLAARIVGDRDDAADITQEVFLKAFTHPPDEKGLRDPHPWLYRVTVNTCYDHLRRKAVRPTTALEDAGEVASARDGFASAEMTRAVEDALGALTPRYRTALVLRDLHGLGTDEVAGVMGVNRATARVLLHRARASFKRAFRETAPAGSRVSTPGLAAFLPALQVPAALQAPPCVAGLTPVAPVALSALPLAAAPAATAPAAAVPAAVPVAGVLAKVGSAAGAKIAVVVAGAAIATGGAVATHEAAEAPPAPTHTASPAAVVHTPGPDTGARERSGAGPGQWAGQGTGTGRGQRDGAGAGSPAARESSAQGAGQRAGAGNGSADAAGSGSGGAGSAGSGSGGAVSSPGLGSRGAGDGAGSGAGPADATGNGFGSPGGPAEGSGAGGASGGDSEAGGSAPAASDTEPRPGGLPAAGSGTTGDAAGGATVAP